MKDHIDDRNVIYVITKFKIPEKSVYWNIARKKLRLVFIQVYFDELSKYRVT